MNHPNDPHQHRALPRLMVERNFASRVLRVGPGWMPEQVALAVLKEAGALRVGVEGLSLEALVKLGFMEKKEAGRSQDASGVSFSGAWYRIAPTMAEKLAALVGGGTDEESVSAAQAAIRLGGLGGNRD